MQDSGQDRSEAATPRRREDARRKGQSATSVELTNGIGLLLTLLVLIGATPFLGSQFSALVHQGIVGGLHVRDWSPGQFLPIFRATITYFITTILVVLLGAGVAGVFANVAQKGFQFSTEPLQWKASKLSPSQGVKKIFSYRGIVRTLVAILKFATCGSALVAYAYVFYENTAIQALDDLVVSAWYGSLYAGVAASLCLIVLGLGDFLFQRWQFEEDLKMTKQQLKDETKENEGDPKVKGKIRKMLADAGKSRSIANVPNATVVLTNPTHYAVAIQYERTSMEAPRVVAKGKGELALRIREKARESGVPILERKMLARALYASTKVGSEIPENLYRAVAEVLSFVYKLRSRN